MNTSRVKQIVESLECLKANVSYSSAARDFVSAGLSVADTAFGMTLRTAVCYAVFHATEQLLKAEEDPIPGFMSILQDNTVLMKQAAVRSNAFTSIPDHSFGSLEEETGTHYGNLFSEFDKEHYFNEATNLLYTRLERNGFAFEWAKGKSALDAGCGGGRYTIALRNIGFSPVMGLDYSCEGIASAQKRLSSSEIGGVSFTQGTVLDLPFPDEEFDFVFSNGVIHHTTDMQTGVNELLRVLKPNGRGFIYLIEKPGGIFWDVIEILRPMMCNVPYDFARELFGVMGVPPNRRYYILDHVMVPINIRSTPTEVESMLSNAGAVEVRRLKRGTDFDRAEQIYKGVPYHEIKFGVGENRYFFSKQ